MIKDKSRPVSVVIVTYNSSNTIVKCIRNIQQSINVDEIVVVDNNSIDETVKKIEKNFGNIKLIKRQINAGFGSSVNMGVEKTKNDYVLILNPDAFVEPDTIERLVVHLIDENNLIAMVTGAQYTEEGQFIDYSRRGKPGFMVVLLDILSLIDRLKFISPVKEYLMINSKKLNKPYFVEIASGACMLIKKDIFLKIGGFDERFFLFGEDIDLSNRFRENGYKILYEPKARLTHIVGESRKTKSIRSELEHLKSSGLLLYKMGYRFLSIIVLYLGLIILIIKRAFNSLFLR
jgi:GT2 family glycosyltransferase